MTMKGELPTPPAGAALVIRAANDPRISLADIARLIEREPSLTVNLLRLANSAAYATGREIKSVGQATVLLGARVIRNIAVAHAVTAMRATIDVGGFDRAAFWEDSLRRACAALVLAREHRLDDPSEAFTVGLIQDLGVLVMAVQGHGDRMQALRTSPGPERRQAELELSGKHHAEHFITLGRAWGLPRDLVETVSLHHADAPNSAEPRIKRLAHVARVADELADITQTQARGDTIVRARQALEALAPRGARLELDALVDLTAQEMATQSRDLDIRIHEQPRFESLVESANQALVRISSTYEELTQRLELLLREKEALVARLAETNAELHRLATTDALTSVLNRRSFAEALAARLADGARAGTPTTLLFVDLDHFKQINDELGHAAGDAVLVTVARRLAQGVRLTDVVGRLGGEEFAVLLPACDRDAGLAVGERLRASVRQPFAVDAGLDLTVTASIGGVTLRGPTSPDAALRLADEAMYRAKAGGRDRLVWAEP
ncbi:MAG: GGDEF domain-containing protein [Deltaproteobacteria bacterium]|nr:GGDEF domain-containing protein [Deltaproteobacteria bacterium]